MHSGAKSLPVLNDKPTIGWLKDNGTQLVSRTRLIGGGQNFCDWICLPLFTPANKSDWIGPRVLLSWASGRAYNSRQRSISIAQGGHKKYVKHPDNHNRRICGGGSWSCSPVASAALMNGPKTIDFGKLFNSIHEEITVQIFSSSSSSARLVAQSGDPPCHGTTMRRNTSFAGPSWMGNGREWSSSFLLSPPVNYRHHRLHYLPKSRPS